MPDYKQEMTAAPFMGALAETSNAQTESRVNEEASAEIPFGVMVAEGSTDQEDAALKLAATDDLLVGVVVHSHAYNKTEELGDTGVKPDVMLSVLRRGVVWVWTEEAVTPDDAVRVRAVATGAEVAGHFRTTADGTDTILLKGCRWRGSFGAGALAKLEIDMLHRDSYVADT